MVFSFTYFFFHESQVHDIYVPYIYLGNGGPQIKKFQTLVLLSSNEIY